ncbi:MAG TPA: RES family NAD+ phosphorylase [Steroidobacteraceae bacterium]|nr:RES family NAD+ phosphorylase [Steroidobacteraceae bacterium]
MSFTTWTPHAVGSEARRRELSLWRAVEAQYVAATRPLVDTLAEQEALEILLEASKPSVPPAARGLDYLLYTPFRYPPSHHGSRFRAPDDPGVWYGAEAVRSSCAELGYWRWRFLTASRGLERLDGVAHTIFLARARGPALDLRTGPLARDRARWTDPGDYTATQALARAARMAGIALLRYESVRDPEHGACGAVLHPEALAGGTRRSQTWFLTVDRRRASWVRAATRGTRPGEAYEFTFA